MLHVPGDYRTIIRVNIALILAALSQLLRPFSKLVSPSLYLAVPSDVPGPGDQYFEHVTANSIFISFLQIC